MSSSCFWTNCKNNRVNRFDMRLTPVYRDGRWRDGPGLERNQMNITIATEILGVTETEALNLAGRALRHGITFEQAVNAALDSKKTAMFFFNKKNGGMAALDIYDSHMKIFRSYFAPL